jgi:hypothetical protein
MYAVTQEDSFSGTVEIEYFDNPNHAQARYDYLIEINEMAINAPSNLGFSLFKVLQRIPTENSVVIRNLSI